MSRFGLSGDARSGLLDKLVGLGRQRAAPRETNIARARLGDSKVYDEIRLMEGAAVEFGLDGGP